MADLRDYTIPFSKDTLDTKNLCPARFGPSGPVADGLCRHSVPVAVSVCRLGAASPQSLGMALHEVTPLLFLG